MPPDDTAPEDTDIGDAPDRLLPRPILEERVRSIDGNDPVARLVFPGRLWPTHWWVVPLIAFVIYGPVEKLLIPALQGYLSIGGPLKSWRPDLEAMQTGFIGFPVIFAYYAWASARIPRLFRSLHEGELFRNEHRFLETLADVEGRWWWFNRPIWSVVSVIVAGGLAVGLFGWYMWDYDDPKPVPPWFMEGGTLAKVIAVTLLFVVFYLAVRIIATEWILAKTLRRLWDDPEMDLRLWSKRDEVGGLEDLAQHVTNLIWLVASVFVTVALASALPALREEEVGRFVVVIVIIWVCYLVIVPAILAGLIWPAHRAMRRQRDARLAGIADRIDARTIEVEAALPKAQRGDRVAIRDDIEYIDHLRRLYDWLAEDLATWPVPKILRQQLAWSTLVPFAVTFAPLLLDYLAPS